MSCILVEGYYYRSRNYWYNLPMANQRAEHGCENFLQ